MVGFLAAYGVYNLRSGWLRNLLVGFSSIAANFAGVPLAFAFVSTLGVTATLRCCSELVPSRPVQRLNFSLYSFWGLAIVYCYFQLPLMILMTLPALKGLRPEWREAATNLGVTLYLLARVALPVLLPSLIAAQCCSLPTPLPPMPQPTPWPGRHQSCAHPDRLPWQGNVSLDTGLGNAMAVGMIVVLCWSISLYTLWCAAPATGQEGKMSLVSRSRKTRSPPAEERKPGLGMDKIALILVAIYFFAAGCNTDLSASMDRSSLYRPLPTSLPTQFLQYATAFTGTGGGLDAATVLLVTPTAYWVHLRLPKAGSWMCSRSYLSPSRQLCGLGLIEVYSNANPLITVLSFGLVPLLSNDPFNLVNTSPLLVCAYVIISLPFVYRPIDNNLRAINTTTLTEAAYSLGTGWWRTFLTVILPNIWPGVISAALLTFSTCMGEFTLASLSGIYTFPIYLDVTGQFDPYKAASLAVLSFLLTLLCVLGIIYLVRRAPGRAGKEGDMRLQQASEKELNVAFLELDGVTKQFGRVSAVDNIHLSVEKGEFLTLLGPSGCGKTTILRMVAGFETPTLGSISLDDEDITYRLASKRPMGMVFQSYALFPHLTAEQNIAFGMRIKRVHSSPSKSAAPNCSNWLAWAKWGRAIPISFLAGSSSALPWRGRWQWNPRCCCWMNRFRRWTPRCASRCATKFAAFSSS